MLLVLVLLKIGWHLGAGTLALLSNGICTIELKEKEVQHKF